MSDDNSKAIVYGAEWCAFCHEEMHYFDKVGVKYEYRNVEENPKFGEEAVKKSGQFGIPVTDIAGEIIIGFDKAKLDDALKKAKLLK